MMPDATNDAAKVEQTRTLERSRGEGEEALPCRCRTSRSAQLRTPDCPAEPSVGVTSEERGAQYRNNEASSDNHPAHSTDKGSLHNVSRRQNRTYRSIRPQPRSRVEFQPCRRNVKCWTNIICRRHSRRAFICRRLVYRPISEVRKARPCSRAAKALAKVLAAPPFCQGALFR